MFFKQPFRSNEQMGEYILIVIAIIAIFAIAKVAGKFVLKLATGSKMF